MQSEDISFKYILTVLKPTELAFKVNGQLVSQHQLDVGRQEISNRVTTNWKQDYSFGLGTVGDVTGASVIIDNIELTWHDDDKITPIWRTRADNEVWDYIDPDATKRDQSFENHPALRTVSLDYQVDGRLNGFINNYGHFRGVDGVTDSLVDNGRSPYVIVRPGEFLFKFQAPIAYWLFRRLYFRIKPKDDYHTTS